MKRDTKKKPKKLTAEEFDKFAEAGADLADQFDWEQGAKTITIDFPVWMLSALMTEAKRQGIGRTALIKVWLTERLDELKKI